MNIPEAIEHNKDLKAELLREGRLTRADAVQLGIDALYFVEDARDVTAPYLARRLKGETEE